MSEQQAGKQPRILLAPYTGGRDAVEHYRVLSIDLGYHVELKLMKDGEARLDEPKVGGPFDLIIQMGLGPDDKKIGGLEHVRYLHHEFPNTPILVVSGHDPSYALAEVKRCGADDFLQRNSPNEIEHFIEHVQSMLHKTAG